MEDAGEDRGRTAETGDGRRREGRYDSTGVRLDPRFRRVEVEVEVLSSGFGSPERYDRRGILAVRMERDRFECGEHLRNAEC